MAYTVLIRLSGGLTHYERGKTYWYSDSRFDVFKEMADWIMRQNTISVDGILLNTKYISSIEPFARCMCED